MASTGSEPGGKPPRSIGVSIGPGWIEFTRTPLRASSICATRVSPRNANFDDAYAAIPHAPTNPLTDDTFTMLPPPAATIAGATTWMPVYAPIWFTSITVRYSSTGVLMIDLGGRL